VIATYNKLEYTQQCIESIRNYTENGTYEIIVVDNNSTDNTVAWLSEQNDINLIINQENLGFPKACNQGIEIANGDNILLLNNDTIVTSNWLTNMITCLYSQEQVGAVGLVTNNISYYQKIPTNYSTLDEMHGFAATYNISDSNKWEECLKLVGFCMLIKTSVVQEIGLLDEVFTPGNYEDDDYSLRIRLNGYRLMVCRDTFIHHYGSASFKENNSKYAELLMTNRRKFKDIWGFDAETCNIIREDLVKLIDKPRDQVTRILDVGCLCGGTLLRIKHLYPQAQLFGIESNEMCRKSTERFAEVIIDEKLEIEAGYFDYILISDSEAFCNNPSEIIRRYKPLLKASGELLLSIPNRLHHKVVLSFISGTISAEEKQYLTLNEIDSLFKETDFKHISMVGITSDEMTEPEREFFENAVNLLNLTSSTAYLIESFLIKAGTEEIEPNTSQQIENTLDGTLVAPEDETLKHLLRRVEFNIDQDEDLQTLVAFINSHNVQTEQILEVVENAIIQKSELLNLLACTYTENELYEMVIPLLNQSLLYNPLNESALQNLGMFLVQLGEYSSALNFLERVTEKNEQIIETIDALRGELARE
jgi:GT2 family glycosyltransferase